ncbi:MAG TPA: hypothetical protein VIV35_10105 [Chitinophagaceae bacterium]
MKYSLLILYILLTVTVQAQFTPKKYFTDSISFSYDECRLIQKKGVKDRIKMCTPITYEARASFSEFSVTEIRENSKSNPINKDAKFYYHGLINSIDFDRSEIVQYTEYGETTTNPTEIYELRLKAKNDQLPFTSKDAYFPQSTTLAIYMFFATESDAKATKDFLEKRNKEWKGQ